uniref:Auxin efflux carrier component n=1 Tax=Pinus tabuliformis TaxID=88731 RepID=A0A0K0M748_PINTB|nr:PIN4 [Pinus tabuliformis]
MIKLKDLYTVISAVVPLYVTMFLAYGSVKWWKIFSPEQCAGINRFVAIFAVPLLSFKFIYEINPYEMNFKFIAADVISKAIVLLVLGLWGKFAKRGSLDWVITLFSLSTLPNTLVMGIPLLKAMYGGNSDLLMIQTVVLQCIIWYTILLFLFEYRSAKILIAEQFPGAANSIGSFKVGSDVMSLDGRELLQTDAEMGEDGKLHVIVRKSASLQGNSAPASQRFQPSNSIKSFPLGRPANQHNTEIYSLQSSRNLTPRDSSFNRADYVSMMSSRAMSPLRSNTNNDNSNNNSPHVCDVNSLHSSQGHTPRTSNCHEDYNRDLNSGIRTTNSNSNCNGGFCHGYKSYISTSEPLENGIQGDSVHGSSREQQQLPGDGLINSGCRSLCNGNHLGVSFSPNAVQLTKRIPDSRRSPKIDDDVKELHMFVWSSSGSPVSEGGFQLLGGSDFSMGDSSRREFDNIREDRGPTTPVNDQTETGGMVLEPPQAEEDPQEEDLSFGNKGTMMANVRSGDKDGPRLSKFTSSSTAALTPRLLGEADGERNESPPAVVMINLILNMVWRKLVRNPNTYASVIGITWALISYRWNFAMPKILEGSVKILSDAGLGMAMFSLGLFMALQPRLIACGKTNAIFGMVLRFLTGPAVMAVASIAANLRGRILHIAIVQAALPQGIVPFVFAREYNLHPDILSTAVIFGMIVSLPITLLYYVLLGL